MTNPDGYRYFRALIAGALIVFVSGCTLLRPAPEIPVEPPPAPPMVQDAVDPRVELLWDSYGVPHIFADDETALFFAHGFAQMQSHADLLLRLYGQSRGRAAEYWGERFLDSDIWVRTNGVPDRADEWLAAQAPHARAYIDAFVAGINEYADRHPDAIGAAWRQVLPVESADVLAHMQRVLHFTFMANPEMAVARQRQWSAGAPGAAPGAPLDEPPAGAAALVPGSNGWAIAPSRSASRKAMLLANPHLPWGDLFTWYESHFVLPNIGSYGVTLVGFPMHSIAFNQHLGWTHTVNTIDAVDVYELRVENGAYVFDGVLREFEVSEQRILVRQPDNTLTEVPLTVRTSVHGPVIAERDGAALALRVAGLDRPHLLQQYWDMIRATDRARFEAAVAQQQLPMFTVIYADTAGSILHAFNGAVPVRQDGDWAYWQGIVPGESSATLWTATHDYWSLPRVVDPPSGWLQNANDPPWSTTLPFPLEPLAFPAYVAPERPMSFRAQRSARLLAEDERITFDELVGYAHDTRAAAADHLVQDLVAAAYAVGSDSARAAADVLEAWDRTTEADSRGAVLFTEVFTALQRERWPTGSMFDVGWTEDAPLATPDGLSDPRRAAAILAEAADAVRQRHGAIDIAWGDVHRLVRDAVDLPASGGPGRLGVFGVLDFAGMAGDSTRVAAMSGQTYVAAIEFSSPIRAHALLTYGNASQPGSPHRTDQLRLFAERQLRTVWLTRAEVEANTVERVTF